MKNTVVVHACLLSVLLMTGAGCAPLVAPQPQRPVVPPAPVPQEPIPPTAPEVSADPYEGWGTIMPGGVVSLRIPPGCTGDPGAGSIYVVCPTPGNETPTPDMRVSSDGQQVNIRRWEDHDWDQWDKVVASLQVLAPLDREIQINIQK